MIAGVPVISFNSNTDLFVYFLIFIVIAIISRIYKDFGLRKEIDELKYNSMTLSTSEFFRLRNTRVGGHGRKMASVYNFAGVYILYNKSRNMYYVGQSKRIFDRVNAHFTGHGNGDVYIDYRYGDVFEISMIALENSGFSSLNELERNAIWRFNAYSRGYNKTRGNQG